ncbi:MAG: DUF5652 family protein [Candidatus Nanoarchaeia archaeon]
MAWEQMFIPSFTILAGFAWLFILVVIWNLVWKGLALWRAARNEQMIWFILMLILNTVGILEIIYILFFQKKHRK